MLNNKSHINLISYIRYINYIRYISHICYKPGWDGKALGRGSRMAFAPEMFFQSMSGAGLPE